MPQQKKPFPSLYRISKVFEDNQPVRHRRSPVIERKSLIEEEKLKESLGMHDSFTELAKRTLNAILPKNEGRIITALIPVFVVTLSKRNNHVK